jgi:hypothetical protein
MISALPEELRDAVNNLQAAEKKVVNGIGIESFTEALAALNECVDEYPEHKKFIENVTSSYIRRIIDILYKNRPDIDPTSWISLILTLFVKHKNITVRIVKDDYAVKTYFLELLALWAEKVPSELKDVLDEILEAD